MSHRQLKNKPLVEAILEIRWNLSESMPGDAHPSHYRLLPGRFHERVHEDYPEHEQLPAASIPEEMVEHVVQHRFRAEKEGWPLVQVGPGVMTVNSTADYTWTDFRPRATAAVERLFDAHPRPEELKVTHLILRYFDAVEFDYANDDAYTFLRDKLKVGLSLPDNLFQGTDVEPRPQAFSWHSTFSCSNPEGVVHLGFGMGRKEEKPAIVWETTVQSSSDSVPDMPSEFPQWLEAAHKVTSDWFFKLIDGELAKRFGDES